MEFYRKTKGSLREQKNVSIPNGMEFYKWHDENEAAA